MLIRLIVDNFFSFAEEKSFDMFPNDRLGGELKHHVQDSNGISLLKLGVIYGANATGKSSLIKGLVALKQLVVRETAITNFDQLRHRFTKGRKRPITLGVEFIAEEVPFLYAIQIMDGYIKTEELYQSGLGETDRLIYQRTTEKGKHEIKFFKAFEDKAESKILKSALANSLIKPGVPVLKLLTKLKVVELGILKKALNWFEQTLHLVGPEQRAVGLPQRIDADQQFAAFAKATIRAYHVGIKDIIVEKLSLQRYYGNDNPAKLNDTINRLENKEGHFLMEYTPAGEEINITLENGKPVVKRLKIVHAARDRDEAFTLAEESDGTKRLFELLPAFQQVITSPKVFVIDEIESSIHPILIKELVRKFSHDKNTRGQLIMTTHESNLLDQKVFRRDEIWFVEKDQFGATDLYSLNKFKEHHTIDIRKGYLSGRYGGIPFTGNLVDLNWHEYDTV